MADFSIKTGDTLPVLQSTLTYPDGTAIDVTGCTVTLKVRENGSRATGESLSATLVTPASGIVKRVWTGSETFLGIPGLYDAEWQVVFPAAAGTLTVPNSGYFSIAVLDDIA